MKKWDQGVKARDQKGSRYKDSLESTEVGNSQDPRYSSRRQG